eukprot:scaffold318833_cov21-Tisochrysis_lutea.AAC.1
MPHEHTNSTPTEPTFSQECRHPRHGTQQSTGMNTHTYSMNTTRTPTALHCTAPTLMTWHSANAHDVAEHPHPQHGAAPTPWHSTNTHDVEQRQHPAHGTGTDFLASGACTHTGRAVGSQRAPPVSKLQLQQLRHTEGA